MDRIKTRLIIAVTNRLSAAEDTNAKADLIEELSENLYQRYLDLIGSGADEETAYRQALDDLGDVEELLEYLRSLGPDGELPRQEEPGRDYFNDLWNDFRKGAEGVVRETISQTKDAVDQARDIVRDITEKFREKYPNGFQGSVHVHFDREDDDHGEHPQGEDHETDGETQAPGESGQEGESQEDRDWSFSLGYSKDRGGFFFEKGQSQPVEGTVLPSEAVKAIDIKLGNGDVDLRLSDDAQGDITLDGDTEQLELRLSESGVLSIRPGKTATSSFFFVRGLAAADIRLTLPRRYWEFIQISTTNGDVTVDRGLEAGRLAVRTVNGDLELDRALCGEVVFKSVSGDLDARDMASAIQAETMSGDLEVSGSVQSVKLATASGDVTVDSAAVPQSMELRSKSGDCEVSFPGGEGFTLQFETISGDLRSDFPLVGPIGSRSGEAIYLDGGQRSYRMASVSGDLTLRQK